MTVIGVLFHFLNLLAPAACVAALAVVLCWLFWRQAVRAAGGVTLFSAALLVNMAVTVAGLVLQGRDGRMVTYGVMVLACATTLWWLLFVPGRRKG